MNTVASNLRQHVSKQFVNAVIIQQFLRHYNVPVNKGHVGRNG